MSKYREVSPERAKVWTEKSPKYHQKINKVPIVYYLSKNRQLEHPHFMEVLISSPNGLYLRGNNNACAIRSVGGIFAWESLCFVFADVIERLNVLRGRGMASMYSWSSKRYLDIAFLILTSLKATRASDFNVSSLIAEAIGMVLFGMTYQKMT